MNGWDLFTWTMAALLVFGSVVVFALFLRDVRSILAGFGRGGE